jgi:hypothetical protein
MHMPLVSYSIYGVRFRGSLLVPSSMILRASLRDLVREF